MKRKQSKGKGRLIINDLEVVTDPIAAMNAGRALRANKEVTILGEAHLALELRVLCMAVLKGNKKGIVQIYVSVLERLMTSWEPYQRDVWGFRRWRDEKPKMASALERAQARWRILIRAPGNCPYEDRRISGITTFRHAAFVAAHLAFHSYLVDRRRKPFSSCTRVKCGKVFVPGRKQKYCSLSCARADSANIVHKRQSQEQNRMRVRRATALLDKWIASPFLQRKSWKRYVTDRSADITPNWLTRYSASALVATSSTTNMRTLLSKIGFASESESIADRAVLASAIRHFSESIERANALEARGRSANSRI